MHPILLDFGHIKIYTYGVFLALAFILATDYVSRMSDELEVDPKDIIDSILWVLILGLLGARLAYMLQNIDDYIDEPVKILKIWEGGLAWYGGVFFGILAVYIRARRTKKEFLRILDIVGLATMLGLAIGRWGCFSAGCCYGKPTTFPTSVIFKHPKTLAIQGIPIHPTQIYEAIGMFFAFSLTRGFILGMVRKNRVFELKTDIFLLLELILLRFYYLWYSKGIAFPSSLDIWFMPLFVAVFYLLKIGGMSLGRLTRYYPGMISGMYFALYGLVRFLLEFLRDPSGLSGFILDRALTVNHLISFFLFFFGIWLILSRVERR